MASTASTAETPKGPRPSSVPAPIWLARTVSVRPTRAFRALSTRMGQDSTQMAMAMLSPLRRPERRRPRSSRPLASGGGARRISTTPMALRQSRAPAMRASFRERVGGIFGNRPGATA
jgi:hypothetical protein